MRNKRKKEKITPENKKLILKAIGIFILTWMSVPLLQGLACLMVLLEEI